MLLDDTVLPVSVRLANGVDVPINLTANEAHDACRSLKGSLLRQEVYALDGSILEKQPYSVAETNYSISVVQPQLATPHAVFAIQQREALEFHYERNLYPVGDSQLPDPRVSHTATLDADEIGNVLLSVSITYPRRHRDARPFLSQDDHAKQTQILATYSTSTFTNDVLANDANRLRHLCESKSYELVNIKPQSALPSVTNLFRFDKLQSLIRSSMMGRMTSPTRIPKPPARATETLIGASSSTPKLSSVPTISPLPCRLGRLSPSRSPFKITRRR